MEQTTKDQGISIADILRMFRGKLVMIICITLAAAILGGAFAVVSTLFSRSYGAEVSFYISPVDDSNSLLPLVQSEAFAEKLLLDENGLPDKELCDPEDYEAALAAVIAAKEARDAKYQAQKVFDMIPYSLAPIQEKYTNLKNHYNEIYSLLNMYKGANSDTIAGDETHAEKIAYYEKELEKAAAERNAYYESTYAPAVASKLEAEKKLAEATELVNKTRKAEDELVEKVLAPWRELDGVKEELADVYESLRYNYSVREIKSGSSKSEVENINFLVITVDVTGDEEFAALILERVKAVAPAFIEKNIEKFTDEIDVECTLISPFSEITDTSEKSFLKEGLTYAIVAAVAAFAIVCVIIVAINLAKRFGIFDNKNALVEQKEEAEESSDVYANT